MTADPRALWKDGIFLAVVVALSLVSYVTRLGFYSDDWAHLGYLHTLPDQSLGQLMQADWSFDPTMWMRPVQLVYFVTSYAVFGLNPLGYHLLNAVVLIGVALAMYLVFRELNQPRGVSLAVALVYVLLPNYSSDRFWILAADGANIGVLFYLLSVYAALHSVDGMTRRSSGLWISLALVTLLLSVLAYEITFLLSFLTPFLMLYRAHLQRIRGYWRRVTWAAAAAGIWFALFAATLYKTATTARLVHDHQLWDQVGWFGEVLKVETYLNFASFGLYFPRTAWRLWIGRPDWIVAGLAAATLLLVLGYLSSIALGARDGLPRWRTLIGLAAGGLVVYFLGYAIFPLTNRELVVTGTGIGNRISIAASAGVAILIVCAIAVAGRALPRARLLFPALVAVVAALAVVMVDVLGAYWAQAAADQAELLDQLGRHVATPQPGTTILVDGMCLYEGPAIVFDSGWDLKGAVSVRYGDPTLDANPIPPDTAYSSVSIEPDGVVVQRGDMIDTYPYGNLLVYNASDQEVYRLVDARSAARYFARAEQAPSRCPDGAPGSGVPVL